MDKDVEGSEPCKILVLEQGSMSVFGDTGSPQQPQLTVLSTLDKLPSLFVRMSADGSLIATVSAAGVTVLNSSTGAAVCQLDAPNVVALAFSPNSTFLQTYQRPDGGQTRNLLLRTLSDGGTIVWQQFQKSFVRADWPTVQFSADESVASRVVTGEVHFWQDAVRALSQGSSPTGRLKVAGVTAAALSPSPPSHVAVFCPSIKGAPANVRVYSTQGLLDNAASPAVEPQALARKSFFKATTVKMLWNEGATGVLVWTHSDVDKTNQSYYGDSALHFLAPDGSFEGSVPLSKEGPIHDVQWSPSGKDFVVVYGFMPSKATLFDSKCKPIFDFGSGPRNLVRWNPHGRFLLLAGFGNLPGDMEFWDRKNLLLLGKTKAACGVTVEWAPHGRTALVATTSPRLRVDNGFKLFKYDASLLLDRPFPVLYEAEWVPAAKDKYPDRPASPGARKAAAQQNGSAAAAKPAPYRPPNAPASSGDAFRAKISGVVDKPKRLDVAQPPPGIEATKLSKSAQKNQKKKQNRAKEKDKDDTGTGQSEGQESEVGSAASATENGAASAEAVGKGVEAVSLEAAGSDDTAKRIRNLTKKLKQIEELKAKVAASGGSLKLEATQQEKLQQEGALRAELISLQST